MFNSQLIESFAKEVIMHDIDSEILEIIVQYCYTGKIPMTINNVESILSTACLLNMTTVIHAATTFLTSQLDCNNCIGFTFFAEQQNCTELFDNALKFTAENFMDVCRNSEYVKMSAAQLKLLLDNNDLNVNGEEDVYDALMFWVKHDEQRKKDIESVFPSIRLTQLSADVRSNHNSINLSDINFYSNYSLSWKKFNHYVKQWNPRS